MKALLTVVSLFTLVACTPSKPQGATAAKVVEVKSTSFLEVDSQKIVFHILGERSYQRGDEIHVAGSPTFYVVLNRLESLEPTKDGALVPSSDVVYKVRKAPVAAAGEQKRD